jgi:hypothetical protein
VTSLSGNLGLGFLRFQFEYPALDVLRQPGLFIWFPAHRYPHRCDAARAAHQFNSDGLIGNGLGKYFPANVNTA